MTHSRSHFWALMLSLLLWGTAFPALKIALNTNPPIGIMFYRYLVSFVVTLVIFLVAFRQEWRTLFRFKAVFLLGLFNFAGSILQFIGISKTTSTKSAVLSQLMILVVPLLAYYILGERLNIRKIAAIILSIVGAITLSTKLDFSHLLSRETVIGDAFVISAVVFWALFIVYTRQLTMFLSAFLIVFANQAATFASSLGAAALTWQWHIDTPGLLLAVYLAVFTTIIPTLLYTYSLKEIDATTSTILGPIELISALIFSFLLLNEHQTLSRVEIIGALLILISTYIALEKKPDPSAVLNKIVEHD
jgi:drug/metabolite transporter (DMT)-like permease